MRLTRRQKVLLAAPFLFFVIPFLLCPAALGFAVSFTNYVPFQGIKGFVGLENYRRLLADDTFRTAIQNVLLFTVATVVLELVVGLVTAFMLREAFRGRLLVRFVLFLPWLISPAASGVIWHQLLNTRHGLLNYWAALLHLPPTPYLLTTAPFLAVIAVEVWRKAPLVTFLTLPGIHAIAREQWDNATLDGLQLIGRLRYIVLPNVRLLLLTVALLMAGDALGASESIFFLTGGGPGVLTITPGLYSYNHAIRGFNWSLAAVPGWLVTGGVLVLGLVYLRLARGATSRTERP